MIMFRKRKVAEELIEETAKAAKVVVTEERKVYDIEVYFKGRIHGFTVHSYDDSDDTYLSLFGSYVPCSLMAYNFNDNKTCIKKSEIIMFSISKKIINVDVKTLDKSKAL